MFQRFAGFFIFSLTIAAIFNGYIWLRLVKGAAWSPEIIRIVGFVFIALTLLIPFTFIASFLAPRSIGGPVAYVGYTWMGVAALAFSTAMAVDVVRFFAWIWQHFAGSEAAPSERRAFLSQSVAGSVYLGLAGTSVYGLANGMGKPRIKEVEIFLPKLDPRLDGYKIAQISDIHVGPTIGRDFVNWVVKTNALGADAVAIVGDLVDGSVEKLAPHTNGIFSLTAPDGVFFVTGNHEYYSGARSWIGYLQRGGIRVLQNEAVTLRPESGGLHLAGIHDWSAPQHDAGHPSDVSAALVGLDRSKPVVLLAHQPKSFDSAVANGVDLQLSGHTHGGQIWPFNLLVHLNQRFVAGLHRIGASQIYVSPGTAYWGPPMRVGTHAEITLIRLRAQTA